MEVRLERSGLLNWIYSSTYSVSRYRLPNSLCKYFWASIFAILIIPITYIGHIVNLIWFRKDPEDGIHGGFATFIHLIIFFIGIIPFLDNKEYTPNYLICMLVGIGILSVAVGTLFLTVWGIKSLVEYIQAYNHRRRVNKFLSEDTQQSTSVFGVIKAYTKGFFDKYCPSITWFE
jgi:hypothetical protein